MTDALRLFTLPVRGQRTSSGRDGLLAVIADQVPDALGLLCALTEPVVDAGEIELQRRLTLAGDRIEIAHLLEAGTALALPAVSDDYVIEGLIGSPAPGEANSDHCVRILKVVGARLSRAPKKERGFYAND